MSEKKNSKFVQKLLDLSKKAAQEVHLRAIRDAFLFTIPFLVLSGFMVFIAWVLFADGSWCATHLPQGLVSAIVTIASTATNGGNNIYSLLVAISMAITPL